jgi:multiple sugar transport system substrate-binding protein
MRLAGAEISGQDERLIERDVALAALDILRRLVSYLPRAAFDWSSINALDAMASGEASPYCPMIFCFNSYARPGGGSGSSLRFAAPPELVASQGPRGAVAGGTGLAVSASSAFINEAVEAAVHLTNARAQIAMAVAGGQPAHMDAWTSAVADEANGGFLSSCRQTMEHARLRPRFAGYMSVQNYASDILREDAMSPGKPAADVIDLIDAAYREARARAI